MQSELAQFKDPSAIEVVPLTGSIGAEIRNINLGRPRSPETVAAIKEALHQYRVIFFRDQRSMTDAQHERFAADFGTLLKHPTLPSVEGSEYVLEFHSARGGRADSWHTDMTFLPDFPATCVFRVQIVPPVGGDTMFADAVRAYELLPEPFRLMADKMQAVHSNVFDYAGHQSSVNQKGVERYKNVYTSTVFETEHPVVAIHPETGERSLLLGHFLRRIKGLNASDSSHVVAILQDHMTMPENTVRWRWQAGDVAVWDNRATQHRAIDDFGEHERSVKRVTVKGEVVLGIDGKPSVAIR